MLLLYFVLIFLFSIHSEQQECTNILPQGCDSCCIFVQQGYKYKTITCTITESNITAVNEIIRDCSNDSSTLGMKINITSPLSGDIRLDMLSNNILYLAIYNQQEKQPVSLVATKDVPNLRTLAIHGIGNHSIQSSTFFSHFFRIEKITLSNTLFVSPPSFSQLYTLTYLSISHSTLSNHSNVYIGEEFVGGLAQLKYLLLSSYQSTLNLSDLAFRGLTSLTALYLLNSNIRSLSENQFRDSRALSHIYLSHNNISFLSSQTFQQLPLLTTVDMSDNPLNCSCPLQWMSAADSKFKLKFPKTFCQYPPESVNDAVTSPSPYLSCPPLSLSLQCLNRSNPLCPSPLSCYDTATSYQCSACPPGYGQVSDFECVAINGNNTNTCASDAQIKIAYTITGAAVTLFFIPWIILIVRQCYLYRGNKYRRLFRRQISKEQGIEMSEIRSSDEVRIGDIINDEMEHDDDI